MQEIGNRTEAARDRPAGPAAGTKTVDEPGRLLEHTNFGVSESDRWTASDPRRRRSRARGDAETLTPRVDQERHQFPLGAARVLELVDQHVMVAGLETEPALGELVHLPQQLDRLLQHVREVEDRSLIERRRYWSRATASIRRTPRARTTLRSRLKANIAASANGAACITASRWRLIASRVG
jgi:hypothetical protein